MTSAVNSEKISFSRLGKEDFRNRITCYFAGSFSTVCSMSRLVLGILQVLFPGQARYSPKCQLLLKEVALPTC